MSSTVPPLAREEAKEEAKEEASTEKEEKATVPWKKVVHGKINGGGSVMTLLNN